jgi:hypothetical protein
MRPTQSTDKEKIADALRAGPVFITKDAVIADWPLTLQNLPLMKPRGRAWLPFSGRFAKTRQERPHLRIVVNDHQFEGARAWLLCADVKNLTRIVMNAVLILPTCTISTSQHCFHNTFTLWRS